MLAVGGGAFVVRIVLRACEEFEVTLPSACVEFRPIDVKLKARANCRDSHDPFCSGQLSNVVEGAAADLGSPGRVREQQSLPNSQRLPLSRCRSHVAQRTGRFRQ